MLLRRKRHKFLMPGLELFLCGERRHVANHRRFFLCDFIDLAHEPDDVPCLAPRSPMVLTEQTLRTVQSLFPLSFLRRVAEITELLQLLVVCVQQRFDPRIRLDIFAHGPKLVVFDVGDLDADHP